MGLVWMYRARVIIAGAPLLRHRLLMTEILWNILLMREQIAPRRFSSPAQNGLGTRLLLKVRRVHY